jgi:hypothetical protein
LSDSLALQRSISHNAGMFVAVAQNPCLADRRNARQWRGEKTGQTSTAPKPILEDRFKSQRIERYIFHQTYSGVIPRQTYLFRPEAVEIAGRCAQWCFISVRQRTNEVHQDLWSQYSPARAAVVCYQQGIGFIRFEGTAQLGAAIRPVQYIVFCANENVMGDDN